ncbi:MAG: ABC transporter ATP-binding protein [Gemmataceae bacterium]
MQGVRLTRSFADGAKKRVALNEVSVNLIPGQLALLMGPSGSGKSTLLAVLSGLLPPDSGQVLAHTRQGTVDVWTQGSAGREAFRRANVGFIFQGYNLFPALSAVQQLELVLKWGGDVPAGEARRRSDAMLERLGMTPQRKKKPAQLSGGEKQRVAIGRALVKDPLYLFADEPTSALDWENGQQVLQLLRDAAHDRGATIFVVSHDERMLPFVDVCYYLNNGQLEVRPLPGRAAPVGSEAGWHPGVGGATK